MLLVCPNATTQSEESMSKKSDLEKYVQFRIPRKNSSKEVGTHERSLERQLEKNHREYDVRGEFFVVRAHDVSDAMKLGLSLMLAAVEYFDGRSLRTIFLATKKKAGRPKNIVFNAEGKGMTSNQFKKSLQEDVQSKCLTKSEILKKKILTRKELTDAIRIGRLQEITIDNTSYFRREELAILLSRTRLL